LKITDVNVSSQAFIFAAIHLLANRMQTLGDKIDPTISSKQWFVLAVISKFEDAPPNIGDAAAVLGTSRQNIKKMALILEKRGFLRLEKDASDLRNIRLFLTEQCYAYFKGREQQENQYLESIFAGIDGATLAALHGGMNKIIENMDALIDGNANTKQGG